MAFKWQCRLNRRLFSLYVNLAEKLTTVCLREIADTCLIVVSVTLCLDFVAVIFIDR